MLYRYQVKILEEAVARGESSSWVTATRCEIVMVPTRIGRWFGCQLRRGIAHLAKSRAGDWGWWWNNTSRRVEERIERLIEAAPIETIEDMPVELLLEEGRKP